MGNGTLFLVLLGAGIFLYGCAEEPLPRRLLFRVVVDEKDDTRPFYWNDTLGRTKGDLLREAVEEALAEWRSCGAVEGWTTSRDDVGAISVSFSENIKDGPRGQRLGEAFFYNGEPLHIFVHADADPDRYKGILLHELAHVMAREMQHPASCPALAADTVANTLTPEDCNFLRQRLAEE